MRQNITANELTYLEQIADCVIWSWRERHIDVGKLYEYQSLSHGLE